MQKKYFEVVKKLEEVFPSTVRCDYTQISPDELWNKVLMFLEECNLRFSEHIMNKLERDVREVGRNVYGKYTHLMSNITAKKDLGFDQNHYFIKDNVARLKSELMKRIYERMITYSESYAPEKFGEESIIRNHISLDSIINYITEMLTITAEKGDNFSFNYTMAWAQQIFLYFGLELQEEYLDFDKDYEFILSSISRLIPDSRIYHGNPRYGDFGTEYESASVDMSKLSANTKATINKISQCIYRKCNKKLNNRGNSSLNTYGDYDLFSIDGKRTR